MTLLKYADLLILLNDQKIFFLNWKIYLKIKLVIIYLKLFIIKYCKFYFH